jgi:FMN phosphatase YigB (HAD superfamily)
LPFELISNTYRLHPADVLVVGDSFESEIDAGNRRGMRTVQILRAGVQRTDHAIYHITSLAELTHFCGSRQLVSLALPRRAWF